MYYFLLQATDPNFRGGGGGGFAADAPDGEDEDDDEEEEADKGEEEEEAAAAKEKWEEVQAEREGEGPCEVPQKGPGTQGAIEKRPFFVFFVLFS